MVIGIIIGTIINVKEVKVKPWSFGRKALIVFILFNLFSIGPIIEDLYGSSSSSMPFAGLSVVVLPFLYNFYALLTIGLLTAYERLKLMRLQAVQKSSNE
ncbi:MAG: hypothetical protein SVM80_10285 [Halobacteriota archaeon]|nr:hypothetical protein [Halobacteriota archaeon]